MGRFGGGKSYLYFFLHGLGFYPKKMLNKNTVDKARCLVYRNGIIMLIRRANRRQTRW